MKSCQKCGVLKRLEDFHRLIRSPDGRQARCKDCVKVYSHAYYWANREEHLRKAAQWRAENVERKREYNLQYRPIKNARWREKLRESKAASGRQCERCGEGIAPSARADARFCSDTCRAVTAMARWTAANPERAKEGRRRREARREDRKRQKDQRLRARRHGAFIENVHPLVILERDDCVCGICGHDVDPFNYEIDHIVPLARGGEHSYANTQVAHPDCNRRKGSKLPEGVAA